MPAEIRIRRQVEFSETDMAGIVHFSNYFRWIEAAEAALFQKLQHPFIEKTATHMTGWPRVEAACQYHAPLRYGDTIEIHLRVHQTRHKTITYHARIYQLHADRTTPPTLAAKAHMTTIHVTGDFATQTLRTTPLQPTLVEALDPPDLPKKDLP